VRAILDRPVPQHLGQSIGFGAGHLDPLDVHGHVSFGRSVATNHRV
jgi:hypothetical protein